jgi:hypothetical protein
VCHGECRSIESRGDWGGALDMVTCDSASGDSTLGGNFLLAFYSAAMV